MTPPPLRCAAYARYSTDRQNSLSISDQVRKCREFALQRAWTLLEEYVFSDEAISGATDNRPGLKALLAAARLKPRPFDVVLVDDTSRLSRKLRDALGIFDELAFLQIRIVFVGQGIDTDSEQAEVLLATHGIVDSLYIRELSKKVYRGVEGRALQGLHTGGRCFGYRNVPIEDPTKRDQYGRPAINGVRLVVEPRQAEIVCRIFELYAAGFSLKRIAKKLNAERVESPRPQTGRISRSWCPSSIRKILHNDRYRGIVFWGRTKKKREPVSGKRRNEQLPPSQWRMFEAADQRIVSEELWDRVQQRLDQVKTVYGDVGRRAGLLRAIAVNSPYLFSGLLKCGMCGANMTVVSGRGRNHLYAHYGCPQNAFRGDSVCRNNLRIRRDVLERYLLEGLQMQVLRREVVDYTLDRFENELVKALDGLTGEIEALRVRKADLEGEVRRMVRALAEGHQSQAVMAEIAKCEAEIESITTRLVEARPGSVQDRLKGIRKFVVSRLADLRGLLDSDVVTARTELMKHVKAIVIHKEGEGWKAVGNWDLLGSSQIVRMDGAGGQS